MIAPLFTLALTLAQTPAQPETPAVALSGDPVHVREIFAAKCAQCHGPKLPRPKGKFGFVTDLVRLAASPDFVVPGDPESSEVWIQIDDGDMPPDKAKAGPLTDDEKHAIFTWIKSGAVAPPPDPNADSNAAAEAAAAQVPHKSAFQRAAELLGKLHIVTIHFPIALLAAAGLAELWSAIRRIKSPLPVVRFCLALGGAAAVVAAALGWLHAYYTEGEPEQLLFLHRWIGTGVGVTAPIIACLSERDARAGTRRTWVRLSIILVAIAVGAAGHFGGLLVYGANFLNF